MSFKDVICNECDRVIDVNVDKHVLLGTYDGDRVEDESYFHYACFVKWYNQRVSEKAKKSVKNIQSKVQGLMENPKIAGILSMVGGTEKLKGMLNTNLDAGSEDVGKMMKDFLGDDPEKMDIGTITPLPKSNVENQDGKPKRKPRAKPTKKKM